MDSQVSSTLHCINHPLVDIYIPFCLPTSTYTLGLVKYTIYSISIVYQVWSSHCPKQLASIASVMRYGNDDMFLM